MEWQTIINQITAPALIGLASAALAFVRKISRDIAELTAITKELNVHILHVDKGLDKLETTVIDHEHRIRSIEREI
jgi:hypothetical protein